MFMWNRYQTISNKVFAIWIKFYRGFDEKIIGSNIQAIF